MRLNPRKKRGVASPAPPTGKPKPEGFPERMQRRKSPEESSEEGKTPQLLDTGDGVAQRKLRRLRDEFELIKEKLSELKEDETDVKLRMAALCEKSGLPRGFRDGEDAGISIYMGSQTRISGKGLLDEGVDSGIIQRCTSRSEFRVVKLVVKREGTNAKRHS